MVAAPQIDNCDTLPPSTANFYLIFVTLSYVPCHCCMFGIALTYILILVRDLLMVLSQSCILSMQLFVCTSIYGYNEMPMAQMNTGGM
jgi:hypothetical protein